MKYLKTLGLFVVAAAAMMAFAGSASATFTSPTGTEYTGEIDATAESSLLLEAGFAEITCTESTVKGSITTNDAHHSSGPLSALTFSNCGGSTVDTLASGSLTISGDVLTSIGSEVTVSLFGTSCVYGGSTGTTIGTATNTQNKKGEDTVTLDVSADLPKISGNFFCANPAHW